MFFVHAAVFVQIAAAPPGARFWPGLKSFASGLAPLLGSLLVLGATWAGLWAATHRARLAAAVLLAIWVPLALGNAAKLASLDLPLLPLDAWRLGDLSTVFHGGLLRLGDRRKWLLLLAAAAPLAAAAALMPRPEARPRVRLAAGVGSAAFLASLFFSPTNLFAAAYPRLTWDSRATCERNGFVVFLAMNCRALSVEEPPGYSEEAVLRALRGVPPEDRPAPSLRPSVVVVLSESFSDPTLIPGVEFDADPVPTLHRLQRDFGRLDLVSPVYCALTCNAELEFLTGLNMRWFPEPSGVWIDWVRRPVPSLASILRERGYAAVALHAIGGIHNDAQVQPLLGFETCVPGERWPGAKRLDWRVTDDSVTAEILRQARELPRPWLLCANTIEGHAPYDGGKYADPSCGIRFTRPLSPKAREILTGYACGLRNADRALAALIDGLERAGEPALVVFYGDHLPDLGDDLLVWRETGVLPPGGSTASLRMRTVPCVVWDNFGKRLPRVDGPAGMSRALPLILDLLDLPRPPHLRLVEQVSRRWPVVSTAGCYDAAGRPAPEGADDSDADLLRYRWAQHDLLFGERRFLGDDGN
jgi:phosphoglycerol transferase MdoB-like AlkP superfamily enzyme